MTPQRGCILAKLMEALQMLKFSIRKESPLKFSDMTWKEELKEFERLDNQHCQVMQRLMGATWRKIKETQTI